jgi:glycosyltransferase involved in cell wall biosynthesis
VVVSPLLSKELGTERIVIEWISQLATKFEIHVYSQSIEDVDFSEITWHRIPKMPGPHLINYLWWFAANHIWRAWDSRFRGLKHDLVFSPGINCLDADAISVHIVFAEFLRRVRTELRISRHPIWFWPRLLHRKLYYRLIIFLERHIYANPNVDLILIARKTVADLERFYKRRDRYHILYLGIDHSTYSTGRRAELRSEARNQLGIGDGRFALLLVGNDWHKKGIRVLLHALGRLRDLPIDLIAVGRENPEPFQAMTLQMELNSRVHFLPPRKDVEFYYAAADAYVGPSLEDTFALPPAEAMACGLPVIVSRENGTSEIITDGVDGLILDNTADSAGLAEMIRRLREDAYLCRMLGENAAETVRQYTWERNGRELSAIFEEILRQKSGPTKRTIEREM